MGSRKSNAESGLATLHRDSPVKDTIFGEWDEKAHENVEEWGLQDRETLLLAMQEELGELTQAHLEAEHEDGDLARVGKELDDLAALVIQLRMRLVRDV